MTERGLILKELQDLLRMDDVLACMLAKKGLEGVVPLNMKIKDVNLWRLLKETTNNVFDLIDHFYDYGMDRLYFELGKYTIIVAPVSKNFGLLVLIPSLANMGLLDVEIENTRRKIKKIIKE